MSEYDAIADAVCLEKIGKEIKQQSTEDIKSSPLSIFCDTKIEVHQTLRYPKSKLYEELKRE